MSKFDFFRFLKRTPKPSSREEQIKMVREKIVELKARYRLVLAEMDDFLERKNKATQKGLRGFPLDISLEEADLNPRHVNVENMRKEVVRRITRVELLDQQMVVLFKQDGSEQISAAELMDISPQGLMFISDVPLQEGCQLDFFVRLGNKIPNAANEFMGTALVRRVDGRKCGLQVIRPSRGFQDYIIHLSGAVGLQRPISGAD